MDKFFATIQLLMTCGAVLLLAMMILISMPKSKLREFLMPIVGWSMALFCGAYVISPVDVVPEVFFGPFGLVDDAVAAVAGFASARLAMNSKAH